MAISKCFRTIAATEFPCRFVRIHVHTQIGRSVECFVAFGARIRLDILVLVQMANVRGTIDVGPLTQFAHVRFPSVDCTFMRFHVLAIIHHKCTAVRAFSFWLRIAHGIGNRFSCVRRDGRMMRRHCRLDDGKIRFDAGINVRDEIG